MPQYENSVSQNGMCDAGENKLLVKEKIQTEMHLLGPNRGMLMLMTKRYAARTGKT
jgi:hypothetical protein